MGPEAKLYQKVKQKTPNIQWNRLENLSLPGMPDALCSSKNKIFFTVEFKVTQGVKLKFSPHQISWHHTHPENTFIIAQALGPRSGKLVHMFRGSRIHELDACGLKLDACCLGLDALSLALDKLGA